LKNNKLFKTLSIFAFVAVVLLITAQSGICEVETVNQASTIAESTNMATAATGKSQLDLMKFGIAMGGALLSIVIIYLGLWVYNKLFVDKRLFKLNDPDDVLNTPKTVDEAIVGFIKRNKL